MQLTVPQRTVADTGSFPVDPRGVAMWLENLRPLESEADAREVYRGLKHSNRLHNDVDRRRAVLSCFIPVLRELHVHLSELSHAQPLPLTREFARNAKLRDSLLREEAFAFKILLSDSATPMADDARRAMQALARQAESIIHGYRKLPEAIVQDAHQLFALAEEHTLLSEKQGSELLSLLDHYRFILVTCIADLTQQRVRQLPRVLDFLKTCIGDIHLERDRTPATLLATDFAVNLKLGSRPEPALSILCDSPADIRWFSIAPILYRIDQYSNRIRTASASLLGSDTLERQSLARLHLALARTRHRRASRSITHLPRRVIFGHKEICAHLQFRPAEIHDPEPTGWIVTNVSVHGICLHNDLCRAGLVQVGELVCVTDPGKPIHSDAGSGGSKLDVQLGVVRWVRAAGDEAITLGVEFLARSVLAVNVSRNESGLIIACKVQNTVLQTLLLPAYLYQPGDRLTATQNGKSRRVRLRKCLQANGLFSHFSLAEG